MMARSLTLVPHFVTFSCPQGVTNIDSVSFTASDAAVDKATQEALKKAVANAQVRMTSRLLPACTPVQLSLMLACFRAS